jgi:hypothetical protein
MLFFLLLIRRPTVVRSIEKWQGVPRSAIHTTRKSGNLRLVESIPGVAREARRESDVEAERKSRFCRSCSQTYACSSHTVLVMAARGPARPADFVIPPKKQRSLPLSG